MKYVLEWIYLNCTDFCDIFEIQIELIFCWQQFSDNNIQINCWNKIFDIDYYIFNLKKIHIKIDIHTINNNEKSRSFAMKSFLDIPEVCVLAYIRFPCSLYPDLKQKFEYTKYKTLHKNERSLMN